MLGKLAFGWRMASLEDGLSERGPMHFDTKRQEAPA